MVVDADQLNQGLFSQEDRSNDNTCFEDRLQGVKPVVGVVTLILVPRTDHTGRGVADDGQKNSETGISSEISTRLYLRTPPLTRPQVASNTNGRPCAINLQIQRENQTISIHTKRPSRRIGPALLSAYTVAVRINGIESMAATGRMYSAYLVMMEAL